MVSLKTILQRAEQTGEGQAHTFNLEVEKLVESANWREVWMPKAFIAAEGFQRNTDLQTKSVFGKIKIEDKDRFDVKIEIEQKVFNKSQMDSGRKAAKKNLEAEDLKTQSLIVETKIKYIMMAFGLMEAEIQQDYLRSQIKNLDQRINDVAGLVARGRISKAELLRVRVIKERTSQQLEKLKIDKAQLRSYLEEEGVLLADERIQLQKSAGSKNLKMESQPSLSLESKSLTAKSQALSEESNKVSDASWPQLSAFARNQQSDGRNLVDRSFSEMGLRLYWEIPIDGLRSQQSSIISGKRDQLEAKRRQLERYEATVLAQQKERLENLEKWKIKMDTLAQQSAKTRKLEESKFYDGRIGLSDLIEADNLSIELQRDLQLVDIEIISTCLQIEKRQGQALQGCGG